jgi:hypothetical protein
LSVKDREIREIVGKRREYLRREAEKGLPVLTCETMPPNWLDGSEASSKLPSQGFVNPFGSSRFASMVSLKSFRMDACLERLVLTAISSLSPISNFTFFHLSITYYLSFSLSLTFTLPSTIHNPPSIV